MAQPITAAPEGEPQDGLRGALGYGVILTPGEADPIPGAAGWAGPFGYQLEGLACGPATYTDGGEVCEVGRAWNDSNAKAYTQTGNPQKPFTVGASVKCSTFGTAIDLLAEYQKRADRALEMGQWVQIANELWTGARSLLEGWTNHRLASPAATVLSVDPVPLVEGIAALEDAFAACSAGEVQVIHAPRKLTAYLDAAGIVHTTAGPGGRLWTANNSLVIADRGYPGTAPDGAPPVGLTAWLYSTGVLTARLGPVKHPEETLADAVAYKTNDAWVRAERKAGIDWLCCHLAIPVVYSA